MWCSRRSWPPTTPDPRSADDPAPTPESSSRVISVVRAGAVQQSGEAMTREVAPMQEAVLLSGVTLPTGETADVLVEGGTISAVVAPGSLDPPAAQRLDLDGYLVLPAPADPHAHLDKALTASRVANPTGDLDGAVLAWCAYRPTMEHEDVVRRATTAALTQLANGVTAIRSHVDVGPDVDVAADGGDAVGELRQGGRPYLDPDPSACQELC